VNDIDINPFRGLADPMPFMPPWAFWLVICILAVGFLSAVSTALVVDLSRRIDKHTGDTE
jgi:hypothetical protein